MNLRRQCFFREMPHGDEHDPSLEQAVNTLSQAEDVERICSYLDMGKVLIVCCGTCNDVLNPEKGIAGTPSFLTDGTWVWPGDLSYYVRNYKVGLACEFIRHMREHNWVISDSIPDFEQTDVEIDGVKLW